MNDAATVRGSLSAYELNRRRVYILPTRYGWMLGLIIFVILLGSINYGNALGYLLTFLLAGLACVALVHTYLNLAGLRFISISAAAVFCGAPAVFRVQLDNRNSPAREALNLNVAHRWSFRHKIDPSFRVARLALDPGVTANAEIAIPSIRRGWLDVSRVQVSSTFPLGLFRTWAYYPCKGRCLVYPRPAGHLPLPHVMPRNTSGRGAVVAGQEEFFGLRDYAPGDPSRAIHWKALARTNELLVKRFHGEADTECLLRWEDTATLLDPEARISQLTQWVLTAASSHTRFGLNLPQELLAPASGAQHTERCLTALALCAV